MNSNSHFRSKCSGLFPFSYHFLFRGHIHRVTYTAFVYHTTVNIIEETLRSITYDFSMLPYNLFSQLNHISYTLADSHLYLVCASTLAVCSLYKSSKAALFVYLHMRAYPQLKKTPIVYVQVQWLRWVNPVTVILINLIPQFGAQAQCETVTTFTDLFYA